MTVTGAPAPPPAIEVRGATKRYGAVTVLRAVSLAVRPGELVTLLGPSGSGKTTLLNIIAGFAHPDEGRVFLGDEDVTGMPPHRRGIGIVFQSYALFPHMNVAENLAFPLKARKLPRAEIAERVAWALSLVRLPGFERRRVDELSGGQRQRVALARAVVFRPRLILMDEPLSALDKQLRDHMQIEIRNLHERLGATTIYVTHDQREALTMSDRIAVLERGRIAQCAPPREIYDRPADAFVADFIGEAVLLPAQRRDAESVLVEGRPLRSARPLPAADDLVLVIRSEKLRLAHAGEDNVIEATVRRHVFQGDSQVLLLELADGAALSFRQQTHVETDAGLPAIGARVLLRLHPEHTVVVPRAT